MRHKRKHDREHRKIYKATYPLRVLITHARRRSKKANIPFDLVESDFGDRVPFAPLIYWPGTLDSVGASVPFVPVSLPTAPTPIVAAIELHPQSARIS